MNYNLNLSKLRALAHSDAIEIKIKQLFVYLLLESILSYQFIAILVTVRIMYESLAASAAALVIILIKLSDRRRSERGAAVKVALVHVLYHTSITRGIHYTALHGLQDIVCFRFDACLLHKGEEEIQSHLESAITNLP